MALGVGDILRVTCNFELQNAVQYQNVFTYIFDGAGGVSDAEVTTDVGAAMNQAYNDLEDQADNGITGQLSFVDQIEWDGTKWAVIANIGTWTLSFTPTASGDVCPNQVSPFVVFKTARPKSVGRKFLFPTMEVNQDAGILVAGSVSAIVDWTDAILSDIDIDVLNTLHPGIVRTSANDFLLFTQGVVTNLVGTQRRRRPGYGA